MVGYDIHEDKRQFQSDGLTGDVTRHSKREREYPYIELSSTEEIPLEGHKLKVLHNILSGVTGDNDSLTISMYFHIDGRTIYLGKVYANQVKAVLKLFEDNLVRGMLNKNTELQGDYLYVLAE